MPKSEKSEKKEKEESLDQLKEQFKQLKSRIAAHPEVSVHRIQELYSWEAPERLFIPRSKKWFTYLFALVLIVILVLLFIREFIIIAPIAAVGFVAYIMATIPPHIVEHKITSEGLTTYGHSLLWKELYDFWFTEKYGQVIIHIDTNVNFPRRLTLLLGDGDQETIKQILVQYIPFREEPKSTNVEKALDYLTDKFHKTAN